MLIILAVISVNLLMNGNIIGRAEQSKDIQAKATELERLELVKGDVAIDNKGKVTVDKYIEEAIKQGITDEDEVEDNGDGSKNIITDNGWNVNIAPDPDNENNVIITIEGKGNELPPRIHNIEVSTTTTTFKVKAVITRLNGGTVTYYYKLKTESDAGYKEIKNVTSEGAIVENLPEGTKYNVKIVAENANGKVDKIVEVTTKIVLAESITLDKSKATIEYGKTITLKATVLPFDTTKKEVKWTSDNTSIATVSDGVITARGLGTTIIKATTTDGTDLTAECKVTIYRLADSLLAKGMRVYYTDGKGTKRLCTVMYSASSSNGLQIVCNDPVQNVTLGLSTKPIQGWNSSLNLLQAACDPYLNPDFAEKVRVYGSKPDFTTKLINPYYELDSSVYPSNLNNSICGVTGDVYKADFSLNLNYSGDTWYFKDPDATAWMASTTVEDMTSAAGQLRFKIRRCYKKENGGGSSNIVLMYVNTDGTITGKSETSGLLPVFKLKTGLKVIGGIGREADPYILSK